MIKIVVITNIKHEQRRIHSILSTQRDFEIVGFGRDSYDALKLAGEYQPHIIIISLRRDALDGLELVSLIKRRSPATAIIILNGHADEECVRKALSAGALGYLVKHTDMDKLADSVRAVHGGCCFISATLVSRTFGTPAGAAKYPNKVPNFPPAASGHGGIPPNINRMEMLIMASIGRGHSNKEIAEKLNLRPGTVRNYLSSAMRKAGLKNRTQIAIFAIQNGLTNIKES
jgi:DNA-binding NarL/FixJ family response regulator